jgi:hypothetical protein
MLPVNPPHLASFPQTKSNSVGLSKISLSFGDDALMPSHYRNMEFIVFTWDKAGYRNS